MHRDDDRKTRFTMLPTLDVLIPCYNAKPFVAECVQSVLDQSDSSVGCVVVDDGSTDGSTEVIANIAGERVRLIRQTNAGVAAARNRALAESTADLVVWLDADDALAPGSIEARRSAFAADPALEMLVGQNEVIDANSGLREVFPQPPCDDTYLIGSLLARRNLPHMNALTFRRSALSKVGGFESRFKVGEDWILWLKAWGRLRWQFQPVVVSFQRQGSHDSLTHRLGKIGHYREQRTMLLGARAVVRELLHSDAPWRRAYGLYAADFSLVYLLAGFRRPAALWAVRSLPYGDNAVRFRAARYLLEALSPRTYARCARLGRRHGGKMSSGAVPAAPRF
jgi:hypothetical protein